MRLRFFLFLTTPCTPWLPQMSLNGHTFQHLECGLQSLPIVSESNTLLQQILKSYLRHLRKCMTQRQRWLPLLQAMISSPFQTQTSSNPPPMDQNLHQAMRRRQSLRLQTRGTASSRHRPRSRQDIVGKGIRGKREDGRDWQFCPYQNNHVEQDDQAPRHTF